MGFVVYKFQSVFKLIVIQINNDNNCFLQHFPNCKTLELEIKATEFHCAHDMLSKILPYLRITSLQLTVYVVRGAEITYSDFGDIFGLLQLEKVTLHIKVYKDYFAGFVLNERFIKNLRIRCPKIRIMAMGKYFIF